MRLQCVLNASVGHSHSRTLLKTSFDYSGYHKKPHPIMVYSHFMMTMLIMGGKGKTSYIGFHGNKNNTVNSKISSVLKELDVSF